MLSRVTSIFEEQGVDDYVAKLPARIPDELPAVGTMAVQLAKHLGAEVTGVCSGANAELLFGAGEWCSEKFHADVEALLAAG